MAARAFRERDDVDADDAGLMESLARGDERALGELYRRHASAIRAFGRRLLRDVESEDLVHDVFLEAWRNAASYDRQRGSVRVWLMVRARSRALDRLRAARPASAAWSRADLSPPSSDDPARQTDRRRVPKLLSVTSEAELEVLLLAYWEGLSASEIARELSIPAGTVKSRIRTALAKVREHLGVPPGNLQRSSSS
jgi:RNA polymerase sigma-70 factor (ECF subfamily)